MAVPQLASRLGLFRSLCTHYTRRYHHKHRILAVSPRLIPLHQCAARQIRRTQDKRLSPCTLGNLHILSSLSPPFVMSTIMPLERDRKAVEPRKLSRGKWAAFGRVGVLSRACLPVAIASPLSFTLGSPEMQSFGQASSKVTIKK